MPDAKRGAICGRGWRHRFHNAIGILIFWYLGCWLLGSLRNLTSPPKTRDKPYQLPHHLDENLQIKWLQPLKALVEEQGPMFQLLSKHANTCKVMHSNVDASRRGSE